MQPMRARVQNGRLTLDEPTTLPEGHVVYLQPVEGLLVTDPAGDLDVEERAELHAELEASLAEADAGQVVPFEAALAELRRRA